MKFFCKYFIKYSRTYKKIDLKSIIIIVFTLMEYQQDRLMINPLLKNKLEVEDDDKIVELTTVNLSKYFKEIYVLTPLKDINIGNQLNAGEELSASLSKYPRIFAPITVGLIEAGEAGGAGGAGGGSGSFCDPPIHIIILL